MKRIIAAALQFAVEPMAVEKNMDRAYELIGQCHEAIRLLRLLESIKRLEGHGFYLSIADRLPFAIAGVGNILEKLLCHINEIV